jgi:hypothetical protein
MTDLKPMIDRIAELEALIKNPKPTPPIGTPVVWYVGADPKLPVAALVTAHAPSGPDPDKIEVVAFPVRAFHKHVGGVLHMSNPCHLNKHNEATRSCGAWDYPYGVKPDKSHFESHIKAMQSLKAEQEHKLAEARVAVEKEKVKV